VSHYFLQFVVDKRFTKWKLGHGRTDWAEMVVAWARSETAVEDRLERMEPIEHEA